MPSQVFSTVGNTSWNWPSGVTSVVIECIGGGGKGGDATGNPCTGGGGKGGGYAKKTLTKGVESSLSITVGAGGTLSGHGLNSNVVQGITTVAQGAGGQNAADNAANTNGAGSSTASGTNIGDVTFAGGNGGTGNTTNSGGGGGAASSGSVGGNASAGTAGTAGTGNFNDGVAYAGAGAAGVAVRTAGNPGPSAGPVYGGGGSGGNTNQATDRLGGNGRQGVVVLTWTVATAYTLPTTSGALALTQNATNLLEAKLLPAVQASVTATPQTAAFSKGYQIIAAQGALTLTQFAASIRQTAYMLAAPAASLLFTAQNAPLLWKRVLEAETNIDFFLQEFGAFFIKARGMTAAQAILDIEEKTANLLQNRVLTAETNIDFFLQEFGASFLKGRTLPAVTGSLTASLKTVNFNLTRKITAIQGSLSMTQFAVSFYAGKTLSAVQNNLTLTGVNNNFLYNQVLTTETNIDFFLQEFGAFLLQGYKLIATQSSITSTPRTVNFLNNKVLSAETSLDFFLQEFGANLSTESNIQMSATQGTLSLTVQNSGLLWKQVLQTETSLEFFLQEFGAFFLRGRVLETETSLEFFLQEFGAFLIRHRRLPATQGSLDIVEKTVEFVRPSLLQAIRAQVELSERTVNLLWSGAPAPIEFFVPTILPSDLTGDNEIPPAGYCNLPTEIKRQLKRGEQFYLAVELYAPTEDEIWAAPNRALFCFSDSRFRYQGRIYQDKISSIDELTKFIGKTFNRFSLSLANVERGSKSGSRFVFKNLIRGFRVGVRLIFPDLPDIKHSRLIWWGRVANTEDIDETSVKIICSQEIGDFSYELAKNKYGQSCPLWFGKGDCLGTQTLEEKSLLFQQAFNRFGQGGCDRTEGRCIQLGNRNFYQGQNQLTITGQFIRDEVTVKKFLFFFKIHKHHKIPVQWSSKNQSPNDNITIPWVIGRARIELHPFVWADVGEQILALMGGCRGDIEGFYNITCHNPKLSIVDVTQHLGEFGGVGSQQPDGRFIQSGANSRLAYCGITYGGSPPADEPEEVPTTSAIVKGFKLAVRNNFTGEFLKEWSNNPVWATRFLITNFQYTVVRPQWFNEVKNQETANYCFTVVEDDTNAEIPVISGSSFSAYENGEFFRYRSTNIINGRVLENSFQAMRAQNELFSGQSNLLPEAPIDGGIEPDIWWASPIGNSLLGQNRTYLALRYTTNGVINDKAKLSDVLFSLILPTFRGFIRFNHFGKIEIDCRKPADNSYIRATTPLASTEIPVASVVKFTTTCGYLLIGVGKHTSEIAKVQGVRYVNGSAQTEITVTSSGSLGVTVSDAFIEREGAPAEIYMDFAGTPAGGEQISLKFVDPVEGQTAQNELLWDYFCDVSTSEDAALMFKTRLMASPSFRESWTADIFPEFPNRIVIRCQTGYLQLDRPLINDHFQGEEVLRVVEVYEDGKDEESVHGIKDNMKDFRLNVREQETYHGVTGTYISAVQDFRETEIRPRVAWDAAEQERNLNLLELDLRFTDNYRQAAFLTKSATIDFVDGNMYSTWRTGVKGMFHEEGEVVAVRHQTMEGISYTPFTIEKLSYNHSSMETSLLGKIYLSAAFDERIAKEEKFLEASLVPNPDYPVTPPPTLSTGGYSSTGTGDGAGSRRQDIQYESQKYETFPSLQVYSPEGRDKL